MGAFEKFSITAETRSDPELLSELEAIHRDLCGRFGIGPGQAATGLLDLKRLRLAMIDPDRMEYAASVAKIGILLAYFQTNPQAVGGLDPKTRHELGLMIKASSNEMATRFSRELGLRHIQQVLNAYGFYDRAHGGGIWMGKHYGISDERIGDPIADNSHAATVRQLLRFYLLLEQGKLVSSAASKVMIEIFESPDIPHDDIKFVKGLSGRGLKILRKWGSWEDWLHDSAIMTGPGRYYVLVALTHNPRGDEYLEALGGAVDDLMIREGRTG